MNYQELHTPKYVIEPEFSTLKQELIELPWLTKRTARSEYFMSNKHIEYAYGNDQSINYVSNQFSPNTLKLLNTINDEFNLEFNGCFLNKYDDQHQHLGWHADDFIGMDQNHPIYVVSFGAEREIWVKPKEQKGEIPKEQRIKLTEGSIFKMPTGFQDTHFHKIPKHDRPCGYRISLTFRKFN